MAFFDQLKFLSQSDGTAAPAGREYTTKIVVTDDLDIIVSDHVQNFGGIVIASGTSLALTEAYNGVIIILTNAAAKTITAPNTLSEKFKCWLFNAGAGDATINPDGAVTINGDPTLDISEDSGCLLAWDDANGAFWAILGGGGGSGTGDVVGPASSVDNNFVLFDGVTGKLIKDSGWARTISTTLAGNSDSNIPTEKAVKTYVDTADALKANLASPTFTGDPKAPTPSAGDNDTSIATTAFVQSAIAALSGAPYELHIFLAGKPSVGQLLYSAKPSSAISFPASLTGSTLQVGVNPAATATYTFKKNGVSFGTLDISTGGAPTWTAASPTSFNGTTDRLSIEAPSPQDSTLSDVGIVLKGTRT